MSALVGVHQLFEELHPLGLHRSFWRHISSKLDTPIVKSCLLLALVTKVPLPWIFASVPSSASSVSAARTVIRLTENIRLSSASEGIRSLGSQRPAAISFSISLRSCR